MFRFARRIVPVSAAIALITASCGGAQSEPTVAESTVIESTVDDDSAEVPVVDAPGSIGAQGAIIVMLDDAVLRIPADGSGEPTDLSAALDGVNAGGDHWIAPSRNGEWLVLDTERFGCEDWSCLAVVASDLSEAGVVTVAGELVHPQEWGAISDDGSTLIITTDKGGNSLDLAILTRFGAEWSAPMIVTGSSPHAFNERGRLIDGDSALLFDCGPSQYGQEGTGICRISIDGTGFERLVSPEDGVGATSSHAARSADISPDGSIVFEADWEGSERLWRLLANGSTELISGLTNDNSPCVLPDGSVASLWLNRDGNTEGLHELTVHAADSADYEMLLADIDVADVGIHCSR
jgi:hypothetical protein